MFVHNFVLYLSLSSPGDYKIVSAAAICAMGAMYFNSASLFSVIRSIMPRRDKICNPRSTNGRINSCSNRPYVAPNMRTISALRAIISVAVISFSDSNPSLSASIVWRMRSRKSFKTIWDTSKFAPDVNGVNPDDPTALGIIAPGVKLILDKFITPSSSACHTPVPASRRRPSSGTATAGSATDGSMP